MKIVVVGGTKHRTSASYEVQLKGVACQAAAPSIAESPKPIRNAG
jgi:hypothetical protein